MSEAAFKFEFHKAMSRIYPSAQINNIESPIHAPGFPDTEVCIKGGVYNIEFKHSANKYAPEVRGTQVQWFKNRIIAGGNPWVLASIVIYGYPTCLLINGIHAMTIARTTDVLKWKDLSTYDYKIDDMGIKQWRKVMGHIMGVYSE